jgi:fibrillarin-like pre-rRNA processing protein
MALPDYLRKKKGFLELNKNQKWISWNPYHSKLSAYVLAGGPEWPFEENSNILYLGAAEGNTVSFLSNICHEGRIIGVDISSVAMAELLVLAEKRKNIIPFLGDAHFPKKYSPHTSAPDILYQDVAQRDQVEIFIRNYDFFEPKCGFLMLKSRSSPGKDSEVFRDSERKMEIRFKKMDTVDITKWAKGHMAYYVE